MDPTDPDQLRNTGKNCAPAHLNVPIPVSKTVEAELVGDLGGVHCVGKVLLVGEDEKDGLPQLVLSQHAHQLVPRLTDSFSRKGRDD